MSTYTPGDGKANTLPKREIKALAKQNFGIVLDKGAEATQAEIDGLKALLCSAKYNQNSRQVDEFLGRMELKVVAERAPKTEPVAAVAVPLFAAVAVDPAEAVKPAETAKPAPPAEKVIFVAESVSVKRTRTKLRPALGAVLAAIAGLVLAAVGYNQLQLQSNDKPAPVKTPPAAVQLDDGPIAPPIPMDRPDLLQ